MGSRWPYDYFPLLGGLEGQEGICRVVVGWCIGPRIFSCPSSIHSVISSVHRLFPLVQHDYRFRMMIHEMVNGGYSLVDNIA